MLQRVAFGVPNAAHAAHLHDLNLREMVTMVPLVVLVFWIGFFPNPLLTKMHASVNALIEHVDTEELEVARRNARETRVRHEAQAGQVAPVALVPQVSLKATNE
jgi:NADH-quinone oxidoreductase subunit M